MSVLKAQRTRLLRYNKHIIPRCRPFAEFLSRRQSNCSSAPCFPNTLMMNRRPFLRICQGPELDPFTKQLLNPALSEGQG